jgi:hypothetical protein
MSTKTNTTSLVKATSFWESFLDGIYVIGSIFFAISFFTGLTILTGGLVTILLSAVGLLLLPPIIILSIAVKFTNLFRKDEQVAALENDCTEQEALLLENYEKLNPEFKAIFDKNHADLTITQDNQHNLKQFAITWPEKMNPPTTAWRKFTNFWGHARAGISAFKNPFTITRVLGTIGFLALGFSAGPILAAAVPIILSTSLITCVLYNRFYDVKQTQKISDLQQQKSTIEKAVAYTNAQLTHQPSIEPQAEESVAAVATLKNSYQSSAEATAEPGEELALTEVNPIKPSAASCINNSSRVKSGYFQPVKTGSGFKETAACEASSIAMPADLSGFGAVF